MGFRDSLHQQRSLVKIRNLFQWELGKFEELLKSLNEVYLPKHTKDKTWLPYNIKGDFSVKSFVNAWWSQGNGKLCMNMAWWGLAPPRAELLVWFILQGKLNTGSRLRQLNILLANESKCPFCNSEEENIHRLFLHCQYSWKVWMNVLKWWNFQFPITATCEQWFEAWWL